MKKIFTWVKNNKLSAALIAVVLYFVLGRGYFGGILSPIRRSMYSESSYYGDYENAVSMDTMTPNIGVSSLGRGNYATPVPTKQSVAQVDDTERKVSKRASMAILVSDVRQTINSIETKTLAVEGFVVNMQLNNPYESQNGNISVRVPTEKLDETMEFLRGASIRVTSERIYQNDITDQYTDVQERLNTLQKTKTTFERIFDHAVEVEDILKVQREILNVQDQIDYWIGREKYLAAISDTSLIEIQLSTDEMELPYAPENPWRPKVVFKYATRSLITDLRGLGASAIWIAVYAVIWAPALLIAVVVYRTVKRKKAARQDSQK